jgi:hypothetical protein
MVRSQFSLCFVRAHTKSRSAHLIRKASLHNSRKWSRMARVCETNQLDRKSFGHCRAGTVCTCSLSVKIYCHRLNDRPLGTSLAITLRSIAQPVWPHLPPRSESFMKYAGQIASVARISDSKVLEIGIQFVPYSVRYQTTSRPGEWLTFGHAAVFFVASRKGRYAWPYLENANANLVACNQCPHCGN